MASVPRPLRRRHKSGVARRVAEALSSCLRSSPTPLTEKRRRQLGGFQLTTSSARSSEILALNRRVVHSLDLDQILAWQSELEVLHHTRRNVSFRHEADDETVSHLEGPIQTVLIADRKSGSAVTFLSGSVVELRTPLSSSSSSSWKLIRRPLRGLSGAVQYMHKRVTY